MLFSARTLVAGPWIGEFGWELFCWHAYIRDLSKRFDKTVVISRPGHELLYEDFCDVFISFEVKGIPRGPLCEDHDYHHKFYHEYKDAYILNPALNAVFYGPNNRKNWSTTKQEFVKYGSKGEFFDILISARNVGGHGHYRNWSLENWEQVVENLKDLKIASIGTTSSSYHVEGTTDLRGISLEELANTMASCKLVVGPSSGPVHFASLCGTPHIVWWGQPYDKTNRVRYLNDWNPFGTKVIILSDETFDPDPKDLISLIREWKHQQIQDVE